MCFGVQCTTWRSEEHTSELQSRRDLVCRLLLEKKKGRCCAPAPGSRPALAAAVARLAAAELHDPAPGRPAGERAAHALPAAPAGRGRVRAAAGAAAARPGHRVLFRMIPRPPRPPLFPYTTLFRSPVAP